MAKRKKSWYKIITPKIFGAKEAGEILGSDPKNILKRTVIINAKELTGDYKKTHINIKLEITKIEDDKAFTEIKGYQVSRAYIQRFVHKGLTNVELIHDFETKDKYKIRVRGIAIANGRIQINKRKSIRKRFIEFLKMFTEQMTLDEFVSASTAGKIQKILHTKLSKIHPIRFVEIYKIKLLDKRVPEAQQANA